MTELQKALLLAIAKANGHPEPEAWVASVGEHYAPPAKSEPAKGAA